MAFCANCGAAVSEGVGFCPGCGKPVGAAAQPTAQTAGGPVSQPAPAVSAQPGSSALTSNVAGALAYALGFITGIIFLVLEPYKHDRFVRFHAMQSIFYSVACIAFGIAWSIMVGILFEISTGIALITFPIRLLISLGFFVLWLYLMYQAYNNKEFRIPVIGALAAKQVG
jgi:uncharacterized membrane protein